MLSKLIFPLNLFFLILLLSKKDNFIQNFSFPLFIGPLTINDSYCINYKERVANNKIEKGGKMKNSLIMILMASTVLITGCNIYEKIPKALAIPPRKTDVPYERKEAGSASSEFEVSYQEKWDSMQKKVEDLTGTFLRKDLDWAVKLDENCIVENYKYESFNEGKNEAFFLFATSKDQVIKRDQGLLAKSFLEANETSTEEFQELFHFDSKLFLSFKRTYNEKGFIVKEEKLQESPNGKYTTIVDYIYDDKDQLVKVEYNEEGSEPAVYEYTYDDKGRLLTNTKTGETRENWFSSWSRYKHPYELINQTFDYTKDNVVYDFYPDGSVKRLKVSTNDDIRINIFDKKGQITEYSKGTVENMQTDKMAYDENAYLKFTVYNRMDTYDNKNNVIKTATYQEKFGGEVFLGLEVIADGRKLLLEPIY